MRTILPLLLMTFRALAQTASGEVEIVAHRGASHAAPENTLASVRLAWEEGADAAEVDVRLTSDRRIVAMHDEDAKRTAGAKLVIAQTPFEALRKLDAGAWKGVRWRNERVPSLEEALALVPDGKRLFIEIKCGEEILDPLAVLLKPWREKAKQIVLICFSYEVISAAKRRFAPFSCYWLVSIERDPATGGWDPDLKSIAEQAKEAGVDGVDLGNSPKLDAANARIFLDQGLELHVWTVNDARLARGLAAAGVQSITTDRPAWLRQRLRSSTESRDPGTP